MSLFGKLIDQFEALNRRDLDGVMSSVAEDGVLAGRRALLALWTEAFDEFRAEVLEYRDADPWVICDTRWRGRGRDSDMRVDVRVADAYEIKNGKITRVVFGYLDVATALKAVGLEE